MNTPTLNHVVQITETPCELGQRHWSLGATRRFEIEIIADGLPETIKETYFQGLEDIRAIYQRACRRERIMRKLVQRSAWTPEQPFYNSLTKQSYDVVMFTDYYHRGNYARLRDHIFTHTALEHERGVYNFIRGGL